MSGQQWKKNQEILEPLVRAQSAQQFHPRISFGDKVLCKGFAGLLLVNVLALMGADEAGLS